MTGFRQNRSFTIERHRELAWFNLEYQIRKYSNMYRALSGAGTPPCFIERACKRQK